MTPRIRAAAIVLLLSFVIPAYGEMSEYEVVRLTDGVHGIVWKDPLGNPTANVLIVINDRDVLVVDSGVLPSVSRRVVQEIRKLTDKAVSYVVNTHWHDDHIFGNQAYREAWPQVEFIAHPNTRIDAGKLAFSSLAGSEKSGRETIERLRRWVREGKDDTGKPVDAARKKRIEDAVVVYGAFVDEIPKIRPTYPDLTVDTSLILHRGARTIEIRYLGLGNTRGDLVVFLPQEKIVATGDLLVNPVPFGIGSYYRQWITTLDRLSELDATILFPGHGTVQRDREYLITVQGLLRTMVDEVQVAADRGDSLEQVQTQVTLESWRKKLAGDDPQKNRAFTDFFLNPAIPRVYRQAKGMADTTDDSRLE